MEKQCPGCGTTFVGKSGFAPHSGVYPSRNATSCPVHASAPALLEALKNMIGFYIIQHNFKCERGCDTPDAQAYTAIQAAKGKEV